LVVALRGLGKKDDVTRRKALEEFKDVWIAGVKGEDDEIEKEIKEAALISSTPVWVGPILFRGYCAELMDSCIIWPVCCNHLSTAR
jgi:hypothetical protein